MPSIKYLFFFLSFIGRSQPCVLSVARMAPGLVKLKLSIVETFSDGAIQEPTIDVLPRAQITEGGNNLRLYFQWCPKV